MSVIEVNKPWSTEYVNNKLWKAIITFYVYKITLGQCQTRNKVEQLSRSTLLRDKVVYNTDGFYPAN